MWNSHSYLNARWGKELETGKIFKSKFTTFIGEKVWDEKNSNFYYEVLKVLELVQDEKKIFVLKIYTTF